MKTGIGARRRAQVLAHNDAAKKIEREPQSETFSRAASAGAGAAQNLTFANRIIESKVEPQAVGIMSMAIATGTRLGRYEIRSRLGAGGMGEVYLAQDLDLDRPVAIKLLLAKVTENPDHLRRFK